MPIGWTFGVLAAKEVLPIINVAQATKREFFTMCFNVLHLVHQKNQTFKHHKYTQTFNFCQTKNSFPRFPDFRYVAYGSLSTVADDGRLQDLLIIQDFSIFFISDGILNQG